MSRILTLRKRIHDFIVTFGRKPVPIHVGRTSREWEAHRAAQRAEFHRRNRPDPFTADLEAAMRPRPRR